MVIKTLTKEQWDKEVDPNKRSTAGPVWEIVAVIRKGERVKVPAGDKPETLRKKVQEYGRRVGADIATRISADGEFLYATLRQNWGLDRPEDFKRYQVSK
jgi:hypothetical protein